MFIYTEKDTESDRPIKNNNLEYKTHQQSPKYIFLKVLEIYKIHIFKKKTNQNDQRFMLVFMTIFIFCIFCIFLMNVRSSKNLPEIQDLRSDSP